MNPSFQPSAHHLIACERERQVFKLGYDSAHDDQHKNFELAKAAGAYFNVAIWQIRLGPEESAKSLEIVTIEERWPFQERFKPAETPKENLTIAGALYTAEKMRIWRTGDKVLAQSYDASINECARLLTIELNKAKPEDNAYGKLRGFLRQALDILENPLAPPP